jgi:hypothetical protein
MNFEFFDRNMFNPMDFHLSTGKNFFVCLYVDMNDWLLRFLYSDEISKCYHFTLKFSKKFKYANHPFAAFINIKKFLDKVFPFTSAVHCVVC